MMTQSAEKQRQTDQTIERDHDDGEHHVARECRIIRAVQHRGRDHDHFNRDRRESKDNCSVGLAGLDRETIGMAHNRNRGPKHSEKQPRENSRQHEGIGDPSSAALPIQRKNPALVRPMSNGYSARRIPPLPLDDFALLETDAMVASLGRAIRQAQSHPPGFLPVG